MMNFFEWKNSVRGNLRWDTLTDTFAQRLPQHLEEAFEHLAPKYIPRDFILSPGYYYILAADKVVYLEYRD